MGIMLGAQQPMCWSMKSDFLRIPGLLWASPADNMVPPLLQLVLAAQHLGRAGVCCRKDLCMAQELPGAQ